MEQRRQAKKPARASESSARAPRSLADAPKRRSSRLDGKPALNYNENALDLADRPERAARSAVPASHGEPWIKRAYITVNAVSKSDLAHHGFACWLNTASVLPQLLPGTRSTHRSMLHCWATTLTPGDPPLPLPV